MKPETSDQRGAEERLGKLEDQNRRLKWSVVTLFVAFSAVIVMGQATPSPHIVEAQKFVLKDANGNVRGWFGIIGKGSEMTLGNANAQPMIILEVSTDSADLHFYGSGSSGMNLAINSGDPSISIIKAGAQGGAKIIFEKNGPSLRLEDANGFSTVVGTTRIEASSTQQVQYTSAASVVLFDKKGDIIWKAP